MKYVNDTNLELYDTKLKEYINNKTTDNINRFAYGIEWDITNPSPLCKRIGNPELHRILPIQSSMRGCLLRDDGTIAEYLPKDDWTGSVLDGSNGQVMVEIPEFYYKFEEDGNKRRCWISTFNLPNFRLSAKGYVGAYEAALDRDNLKLSSVVNASEQYRGGNNNADWDGTYRSLLGMPATSISLNSFRTYARNRDASSYKWNVITYRLYKMIVWLYFIEYANFNSQGTFNTALDENGYHQGGLGVGVTTLDGKSWSSYNGYYPLVPCGVTNSLGNHTGTVDYNVIGSDGSIVKTFAVPRYRGVENPFGHLWKWTDGCKCIIQSEESGGLSKFYVCNNPAKFTESGVGNYDYRGDLAHKWGHVKALILGEDGEIMPLEVDSGNTMYFCDYFYTSTPTSGENERGVLSGGSAYSWPAAGFVCASVNYIAMGSSQEIGSRLCFES